MHSLALAFLVLVFGAPPTSAPAAGGKRTFQVGLHALPPFMIQQDNGEWTGISVELLKRIALEMDADLVFRDLPVAELVAGTNPAVDISMSFNVNSRTDGAFDLSHAFYSTGLAIAVGEKKESTWSVVGRIFSGQFLWILIGAPLVLALVGLLMWWLERRPVKPLPAERQALSKALFWAFEPVIGYKASQHVTRAGRILGTMWGLFGVVFISGLTAKLASQLTVNQLADTVRSAEDLPRVRVGTVNKTAGIKYCEKRGIRRQAFDDVDAALAALERGELDAVIDDQPILAYSVERKHSRARVLPFTFEVHGYAFGLRLDSPIRRELNKALLKITATEDWRTLLVSYLGRAD